jgi:hypothetical protein
MTMAMFTRLLEMRIVASKRRGMFRRDTTRFADFVFSLLRSSRSCGVREKYATSDPEISPEQIRRTIRRIAVTGIVMVNASTYRISVW